MRLLNTFIYCFIGVTAVAQKQPLTHDQYNEWKRLSKDQLSRTGKYISYEITPHRGDGYLYFYNVETKKLDSFYRSKDLQFNYNESYFVYTLTPGFDTLRQVELDKVDKKKWPKDSTVVYLIDKDSSVTFSPLKSFAIADKSDWIALLGEDNKWGQPTAKKKLCKKKQKKLDALKYETKGTTLTLWNPITGEEFKRKDVTEYKFSNQGKYLAYVTQKADSNYLHIWDIVKNEDREVTNHWLGLSGFTFSEKDDAMAFFCSQDTCKNKQFELALLDVTSTEADIIIDTTFKINDYTLSTNRKLSFTKDSKYLYFGVGPAPENEKKDTLLKNEIPVVDIWHYAEKELHTQQLHNLKRDLKKTDLFAYSVEDGFISRLSNDTLQVRENRDLKGGLFLGSSNEAYALAYQWDMSDKEDFYLIEANTSNTQLIKRGVRNGQLSPMGTQFVYFHPESLEYYIVDIKYNDGIEKTRNIQSRNDLQGQNEPEPYYLTSTEFRTVDNYIFDERCITCLLDSTVIFTGDVNGMPMDPYPLGIVGWMNEDELIFRTKYDVYSYTYSTNSLTNLTFGEGLKNKIEYSPYLWQYDSTYITLDNFYFKGQNEKTRGSHFAEWGTDGLKNKQYWDKALIANSKAKEGNVFTFRTQTVSEYPELQITNRTFDSPKQISVTNPQQSNYNWATVELINWTTYEGLELEGLLYKPEDFDPKKSYPLMVYYYELYTDRLHTYYSPKPTASIIYPTEYASGDYIVFIPDIRYNPGYPAKSAYDCIMSGTDKVLQLVPNIDSTKMGLQGQSWGGYQTAQLITMTNRYSAAMAGAPVSNMFSAYGGIRWGSGLNRQFQYEKTQSRIGKTIWEAPELYVENSPLFHLPNVETPLLIMHNDGDGAVPWYQGIELFTGMRRLGKPCWLLNYNDDDHNLMKDANRRDLSRRMREFFDYYLQDKPAPEWLEKGVPATRKDEVFSY